MRDEYDIMSLNPRKNPYTKRLRQQITININNEAVAYFKAQSAEVGIPSQTLCLYPPLRSRLEGESVHVSTL